MNNYNTTFQSINLLTTIDIKKNFNTYKLCFLSLNLRYHQLNQTNELYY